jgi:Na+/H+ antiporter NhaC
MTMTTERVVTFSWLAGGLFFAVGCGAWVTEAILRRFNSFKSV